MWYACLAEPPPGAVATGVPMAKGRSLSQFQESFPTKRVARPSWYGDVGSMVSFAPAALGVARRL